MTFTCGSRSRRSATTAWTSKSSPASKPPCPSAWSPPTPEFANAAGPATRWADTWRRCWEAGDVEGIVALYAPNATFLSEPFREVRHGRDGVRAYVSEAFAGEHEVRATFGTPVVSGERASVEWWTELLEDGTPMTLAGTSTLRFDADGLVVEQRDTWNAAQGRRPPPAGWGS